MTIAHLYMSWINANKEKSFCLLYIELLAKSIFITCGLKLDKDNDKEDELHFHLCILNWWMSWKGLKFLRRRWYRGQSRFQSLSQTDTVFRISTRLAPEREVQCQAKLSIWRFLFFFCFSNVVFCIFIFRSARTSCTTFGWFVRPVRPSRSSVAQEKCGSPI